MNVIELLLEFLLNLLANGTVFCLRRLFSFVSHLGMLPIYAGQISLELICIIHDHYYPPPTPPTQFGPEGVVWPDDAIPPPYWTDPKYHDVAPLWYIHGKAAAASERVSAPAPAPQRSSLAVGHHLNALLTALLAGLMAMLYGIGRLFTTSRRSSPASASTSLPVTSDAGQLSLRTWSSSSLTKLHEIIEDQELEGPVPPEFGKLQVSIEAVLKERGVEV